MAGTSVSGSLFTFAYLLVAVVVLVVLLRRAQIGDATDFVLLILPCSVFAVFWPVTVIGCGLYLAVLDD